MSENNKKKEWHEKSLNPEEVECGDILDDHFTLILIIFFILVVIACVLL